MSRRGVAACALMIAGAAAGCGGGERVLYDFLNATARGSARLDRSRIEFSAEDDARGFLVAGWSAPEVAADGGTTFARMSGDRRARLKLPVFDTGMRRLIVRCRSDGGGNGPRNRLRVRLNRKVIGRIELRPALHTHALPLPPGSLRAGDNWLSFAFVKGRSARRPGDRRPPAAVFDFLTLSAGEDGPPPAASTAAGPRVEDDRIVQPARSELRFPLILPRSARLALALSTEMTHGDFTARILLRRPGAEDRVLFAAGPEPRRDDQLRIDLGDAAGDQGEIVFQVLATGEARGHVAWKHPLLTGEPGDMDVASNVVLIVIDTLRSDALACYGGPVPTPNIDALAASGVLFRQAYAHAPMTMPSHASMFTSLLPSEHGAELNTWVLAGVHLTLAEQLRRAYRKTAAFVSLGVLAGGFGTAQGFDEFHDRFGANWWKNADEMNRQILPWVERQGADPFFLWAHYSDPHEPYTPPGTELGRARALLDGEPVEEIVLDGSVHTLPLHLGPGGHQLAFEPVAAAPHPLKLWQARISGIGLDCGRRCQGKPASYVWKSFDLRLPASLALTNAAAEAVDKELSLRALAPVSQEETRRRYREEVAYVDREIGKLLDTLRRSGLAERTLVVLTSDHGEGLGDHGLGGHVEQLYDTLLRVPLLMSYPGRLPAGRVIDEPVSHVDLLPTVLDLLAIPDPAARTGRSLLPLILSTTEPPAPIFAETFRPQAPHDLRAVVDRGFKLIRRLDDDRPELYDLASDPGELNDLAAARPELVERLQALMDARMADAKARHVGSEERPLGGAEREKLRALGYLR